MSNPRVRIPVTAHLLTMPPRPRRIVDDILTISKLDSGLLAITPVDADPRSVASHAVKMFESEAKAAGVDMTLHVNQSYRYLKVDWVSLDPTRLLQVLINLITNALKFTRLEPTRHIKVVRNSRLLSVLRM